MPKNILTLGLELASDDVQTAEFRSKTSLLDWDIVLFRPSIWEAAFAYGESYQGKACLDDTSSFSLKEASEHWRREIKQAIEVGKTIVVFLPPVEEVFVATASALSRAPAEIKERPDWLHYIQTIARCPCSLRQ
jgi:hypothetical protein